MKHFYMAYTAKQDRNHRTFSDRPSEEYDPGYYADVISCTSSDNVLSRLNMIGGLVSANIFPTKKEAKAVADYWNECYKRNGTYFFQTPEQARNTAWFAQVDAERERNLDGGEVAPA